MKRFILFLITLFTLSSLFVPSTPILADDDDSDDGPKIKIEINNEDGKFKFKSKGQKFQIKALVTEVVSEDPLTVTIGPGDQEIILDPDAVDKFKLKGIPEVGGKAKIKGVIIDGSFYATKAKFHHPKDHDDHDGDVNESGILIDGDEFEIRSPVDSASPNDGTLTLLGQTVVIDPSQVDSFKADIQGDPEATAAAKVEGEFGSDGTLLAEEVKVRPAPFGTIGATIMEVINTIFAALKNFFAAPAPTPSPSPSPSPTGSPMPTPIVSPSPSPSPAPGG